MKRTRTPIRPLFQGPGPGKSAWNWVVTLKVGPSGYVQHCHVQAARTLFGEDPQIGTASGAVPPFIDVHEVIELLATEAMLVSSEPTLFDHAPHRDVDVSTSL